MKEGGTMLDNKLASYRSFLDYIYEYYSKSEYLETDPLEFYYLSKGNKEYSAFVASVFAYGRVNLIRKFLASFFEHYGENPPTSIISSELYYRFQKNYDIECFMQYMCNIYTKYETMADFFLSFSNNPEVALVNFCQDAHNFGNSINAGKGYYFLFPNPLKSSAKRMRMFLRWMIRKDNIDPGIWSGFNSSDIFYPLDTHIIRFAFSNNIISSQVNSYKNTQIVTQYFKLINNEDPVKYDFSLSRLGIVLNCQYVKDKGFTPCITCMHENHCPF